jgi:hypothetical protein
MLAAQISCGRPGARVAAACSQSLPAIKASAANGGVFTSATKLFGASVWKFRATFPTLFATADAAQPPAMCANAQAEPVSSVFSRLGFNIHLSYTDGRYAAAQTVIDDLKYLGVIHVRDAAPNRAKEGQGSYDRLADAGFRFDMIVGAGRPIAQSIDALAAFDSAHPGALIAIEGPNEINNWPISYNGLSGAEAGIAFQSALFSAAKAHSRLSRTSVYNLTGSHAVVSGFDFTNIHPYPPAGAQPYPAMAAAVAAKAAHGAGGPLVITEDGYNTAPGRPNSVDLDTQATRLLNMVFDAQRVGAARIYLYQLLDAYPPGSKNGNEQFGVFDYDNSPKPAAKALHNLAAILADSGEGVPSAAPFNYTVEHLPATGAVRSYRKGNGAFVLVLWNEPASEKSASASEIGSGAYETSISFPAPYARIRIFDPLAGVSPVSEARQAASVKVTLTDHPLIVELLPTG